MILKYIFFTERYYEKYNCQTYFGKTYFVNHILCL